MFVTNDTLEMIVTETMNYSMMKHGVAIKLNKDDQEQFVSVYYNMGLVKMPDVRCYCDTYSIYPPVADVMSRTRFQQIQTCLHFTKNELVTDDQKKIEYGSLEHGYTILEQTFSQLVDLNSRVWMK